MKVEDHTMLGYDSIQWQLLQMFWKSLLPLSSG